MGDRIDQPLMFQEITDVSVITNQVLQTVELSASDIVISTHRRHPEVVDPRLAEVGEDKAAGLPVALPDHVAAVSLGCPQSVLGLEPVHPAMIPLILRRGSQHLRLLVVREGRERQQLLLHHHTLLRVGGTRAHQSAVTTGQQTH